MLQQPKEQNLDLTQTMYCYGSVARGNVALTYLVKECEERARSAAKLVYFLGIRLRQKAN